MADVVAQIATDLNSALEEQTLSLPSLPEVALRVRDEAESPNVSAVSLGTVIKSDPALAAQLVRTANSPLFRAVNTIDDIGQAISRVGVEYAANVVVGLSMRDMFQATSEMVDKKLRQVWSDSCKIASLSSILCQKYTPLHADQATLAGLTHAIGVLPILDWVEEHGVIRDSMTLETVIAKVHPLIGRQILRHWEFSAEISKVPAQYLSIERAAPTADYVDIVCAANLIHASGYGKDPEALEKPIPYIEGDWRNAQCFERLGIELNQDNEQLLGFIEEADAVNSTFS